MMSLLTRFDKINSQKPRMASSCAICVECGEAVESLFVEFTKGNIKLTRCSRCTNVADKYIEYELVLVVIDIILHRKPAFRHLLFNRTSFEDTTSTPKWIFLFSVLINAILKYIVLHDTLYATFSSFWTVIHIFLSSIAEHIAFVAIVAWILKMNKEFQPFVVGQLRLRRIFYFALCYPDMFKCIAIFLQIFGNESFLLALISFFIMSLQNLSLQSLTNSENGFKIIGAVIAASLGRLVVRLIFFNLSSTSALGWIV